MHKYFRSAFLYLLIFLSLLLWNVHLSGQTLTLANGGALPADLNGESYVLKDWFFSDQEWQYTFSLVGATDLALVTADISKPFSVTLNGTCIFQNDSSSSYNRVRYISLPSHLLQKENQLKLHGLTYQTSYKFLLAQPESAKSNLNWAHIVEMTALGGYIAILIHSISLYMKKTSETYLLALAFLASLALCSYITNSQSLTFSFIQVQPIRYLRTSFSVVLCFQLCRLQPPKKWRWVLRWPGLLLFVGAMMSLNYFGLSSLYDPIVYGLSIPTSLAVIIGHARGNTGSIPLLVGTALRESLRIYNYCYNARWLTVSPYATYFYLPQLSNAIFAVACMISIDCIFAEKFQQADSLAVSLEQRVADRTSELESATKRLQEIQLQKDQMTTGIYHDLRNPIFIAQGSAEMLQVQGEKNLLCLETIRNRLAHLSHLTEELFLLSKLEDQAITFDRFNIPLHALTQNVLSGYALEAQQKGIRLLSQIPEDLQIVGDSYHIKKVIENLVNNAIHFTQQGQVVVSGSQSDSSVTLRISDTGCGIEQDALPHIFDRYYHREKASSGLGLFIVYQIVKAHGGSVSVESTPGQGSCFTLSFPKPEEE